MATGGERPTTPRRQLGEALLLGGIGALIVTPLVYRIRATGSDVHLARNWLWPTWWMLVPLLVAVIGAFLMLAPPSFDLRRTLTRRGPDSRRRGS